MRELRKYPLAVVKFPKGRYDPAEMTKREIQRQLDRAQPIFSYKSSLGAKPEKRREFGPENW
jgi:hypothetical protein